MIRINTELLRHDLLSPVFEIGWFPDRLEQADQRKLQEAGLGASELRLSGIPDVDDLYDEACATTKRVVMNLEPRLGWTLALFHVLGKYETMSRVRTRKGAFPKIPNDRRDFLTEVERAQNGESVIGGMLAARADWMEDLWELSGDYGSSAWFIDRDRSSAAPERSLVERAMDGLEGRSVVWIDYPRLVVSILDTGYSILRRGGDGQGTFVNLAFFGDRTSREHFEQYVQTIAF